MSRMKLTRARAGEASGYAPAAPAQPGAGAPGRVRLLALPTPVPEPLPDFRRMRTGWDADDHA
jgi:hypothetical protein